MENNLKFIRRLPLPPELIAEIHKCLPLDHAVNILVNVPTRAIVQNNKYWLLRNIRKIKKSLIRDIIHPLTLGNMNEEEIEQLDNNMDEFIDERAELYKKIDRVIPFNQYQSLEWCPQMDVFFRYGAWLTPTWCFFSFINGVPDNFVENLIVYLANSPLAVTGSAFQIAQIWFEEETIEHPESLKQLLEQAKMYSSSGSDRILFESIDLKIGENIVHIFGGQLWYFEGSHLTFNVVNREDPRKWFQISFDGDGEKETGTLGNMLIFTFEAIQPKNEYMENGCKWFGHNQIPQEYLYLNEMDSFLRFGAKFTHFRHFHSDEILHCNSSYYAEELICFMAYTKHPEYVFETIEIKIAYWEMSKMLHQIWNFCRSGIPKGGQLLKSDNENLFILAGTAHDPIKVEIYNDNEDWGKWLYGIEYYDRLEFTLGNWPSNFGFLFDFHVIYPKHLRGKDSKYKTIEIVITRRKNEMMKLDDIIGSNNNNGIEKKLPINAMNRYYENRHGEYKKRKYFFQ